MRRTLSTLLLLRLSSTAAAARPQDAAKIVQPSAPLPAQPTQTARPLSNDDVLKMVALKLAPEDIVEKMRASACDFDTSPETLGRLKEAGGPDSLLLLMVMSPRSTPSAPRRVAVQVPAGTVIEKGALATAIVTKAER